MAKSVFRWARLLMLFRTRRRLISALSLVVAMLAGGAQAMNITVAGAPPPAVAPLPFARPKPVAILPVPTLRVTGLIETGDAEKLRLVLVKLADSAGASPDGPLSTIEFSSLGGNLIEGFEIGGLLRKFRMIAIVRKGDICMSSCALALLGGNIHHAAPINVSECNVELGAKVAFHNFFLNRNGLSNGTATDPVASRLQGFADARGGAAMLVKYAGEMGLQPNFVATLMGRPVEEFQYIETVAQFLAFHVCPIGLARPSASLEIQASNLCRNSLVAVEPQATLQARSIPVDQAKLYLLERMQASMQSSSKARGRLSAQLASGAVMRNKDEIDHLYEDLRAAGVALPDIVGPTFEITGGPAEVTCYASLSTDNPDTYDVSLLGPRGFSEPPRLPPENSRRLFLYDRNDVVNPKL
jgi:hypothetical protein